MMIDQTIFMRRYSKPVLFVACLLPAIWLGVGVFTGTLGANPIEALNRGLGDWALRFLLFSLAITPIRLLTGWAGVMRYRRMIGLYAFFYVCLHLSSYLVLDQFFDWAAIWKDIVKRPYITVGFAVFLGLLPLAITSTNQMIKRLGAKRWKNLHKLVYACAIGGVFHYFMLVKADYREPLVYALVLGSLFALRLVSKLKISIGRRAL